MQDDEFDFIVQIPPEEIGADFERPPPVWDLMKMVADSKKGGGTFVTAGKAHVIKATSFGAVNCVKTGRYKSGLQDYRTCMTVRSVNFDRERGHYAGTNDGAD